jgi:hypothetical protein
MGTSVQMIDKTYGHLAHDAEEWELERLAAFDSEAMDARWTHKEWGSDADRPAIAGVERSPLPDSNRRPPPYHGGFGPGLHEAGTALSSALSL